MHPAVPLAFLAAAVAPVGPALHRTRSAVIHLAAPPGAVFPLFGPLGEKRWAGSHWSPDFVHPAGGADVEGCVFTTGANRDTTWILTTFDPGRGRIHYVHVTPRDRVVQIDISLSPDGSERTSARVTYSWTGLSEEGNRAIEDRERTFDAWMGEWESAINACLAERRR